ncbi:MAG: fibronectin type III domain-containing protein [Eubacteriales bacterium]|nr:fibronectin type III domain-containing protein [Eubacteriales bacterium]
MKWNKKLLVGVMTLVAVAFAKAPVAEASALDVQVSVHKEHAGKNTIQPQNGANIHFLWDKSVYVDEDGKRYTNVLENHPSYLKWTLKSEKLSNSDYEATKVITAPQARVLTDTLGASEEFYNRMLEYGGYSLRVPELRVDKTNGCNARVEFTCDPASAKLVFYREANTGNIGDIMKIDSVWYSPQISGIYKVKIVGDNNKQIGYMEIPITCEVAYKFRFKENLKSGDNEGYLRVWSKTGIVLDDTKVAENLELGSLDAQWYLATYYKQKNIIAEDWCVLEPGQKLPVSLSNQDDKNMVCNAKARDAYYVADKKGVKKCTASKLPVNIGYKNGIVKVGKNGVITALKDGVARVDVYYPATGQHLVYKIVVKQTAKKVAIQSAKGIGNHKLKLTWKKASKVDGYQIQYATNSKFKNAKTKTIGRASNNSCTLEKLSSKTYYVRIRSYVNKEAFYKKTKNGYTTKAQKFPSAWSKAKKVTVK